MSCPVCKDGEMISKLVDKWMQRGTQWILIRNASALVCDLCGETAFSQDVTDRLLDIAQSAKEIPTRLTRIMEFDLKLIDEAREHGEKVVTVMGNMEPQPVVNTAIRPTREQVTGYGWVYSGTAERNIVGTR